jgi:hypothetical protein
MLVKGIWDEMSIRDAIIVNGQPLNQLDLLATNYYDWQEVTITCVPQPHAQVVHLRIGDTELGAPTLSLDNPLWRWCWNPQRAVGIFDARLEVRYADGTAAAESFRLRIRPRAIDVAQYEALIEAVQGDLRALVYAFSGGRVGAALPNQAPQRTLIEEYFTLVEHLAAEAVALAQRITAQPHQMLRQRRSTIRLTEAERLDTAILSEIAQAPLDQISDEVPFSSPVYEGPLPQIVPVDHSRPSYDSVEHRLLKHVLQELHRYVNVVHTELQHDLRRQRCNAELIDLTSRPAQERLRRCAAMRQALRRALAAPLLEAVGPWQGLQGPTHLMRRVPHYRRLYELYRRLHTVPLITFDSPTLWLPLHDLPLLYEQWCVLQTIKALLPLGAVIEQRLLICEEQAAENHGYSRWVMRLPHNVPLLTLQLADREVSLFYQRRYQPQPPKSMLLGTLDPYIRIPDIAIEVAWAGQPRKVLILDAKYQVAPGGYVPQTALDDAYTYRSAIGADGRRATLGSFLLFPGSEATATTDDVGALPLLPPASDALPELLRRFVDYND